MKASTYVSLDPRVTPLLGYRWIREPGFTIPETREEVKRALNNGKLKAAVQPPLRLIEKPTRFAKALRRDKIKGYKNCVNLMRYLGRARTISSPRWSAGSAPPFSRLHADGSINVDGNGDRRLLLDTSSDSATIRARLSRRPPQDEGTDDTRDRTMIQLAGNDPSSEDLAPIPRDSSVSRLALPEPWATKVKSAEDKAHNPNIKGGTPMCFTCTGTSLTLKSLRPLLAGRGKLDREIVDACLSMLAPPMDRLGARQKTVLFESAFWRTYWKRRGHLGRWYDMVVPLKDTEMLLFPVCQDGHWTLFEVSLAERIIRNYAPVGLDLTGIINMAVTCLKTEFGIEGLTLDQRPLPQGDSGVLILATAVQRVLRKDVEYFQEDILGLRRLITAVLFGVEMWELGRVFDSL
jgi:hypothetical protein